MSNLSSTVTSKKERPSSLVVWLKAIRPATLWAGAAPVLVGMGLATQTTVIWDGLFFLTSSTALWELFLSK